MNAEAVAVMEGDDAEVAGIRAAAARFDQDVGLVDERQAVAPERQRSKLDHTHRPVFALGFLQPDIPTEMIRAEGERFGDGELRAHDP